MLSLCGCTELISAYLQHRSLATGGLRCPLASDLCILQDVMKKNLMAAVEKFEKTKVWQVRAEPQFYGMRTLVTTRAKKFVF